MFTPFCIGVRLASHVRVLAAVAAIVSALPIAQVRAQSQEAEQAADGRAKLEKQFTELLDGATLVGHFTVTGRETLEPKEERYTIESVEKLPGGRWLFRSRIRYGDHDVTVPLPLPVEWAGDTPVIVVDNVQVPTLGTFNARVMFFDRHYAGYWSGGDHGGHLFGVVERESDDEATEGDVQEEQGDQ